MGGLGRPPGRTRHGGRIGAPPASTTRRRDHDARAEDRPRRMLAGHAACLPDMRKARRRDTTRLRTRCLAERYACASPRWSIMASPSALQIGGAGTASSRVRGALRRGAPRFGGRTGLRPGSGNGRRGAVWTPRIRHPIGPMTSSAGTRLPAPPAPSPQRRALTPRPPCQVGAMGLCSTGLPWGRVRALRRIGPTRKKLPSEEKAADRARWTSPFSSTALR